jgi:hypothetical protein
MLLFIELTGRYALHKQQMKVVYYYIEKIIVYDRKIKTHHVCHMI